MTKEMRIGELEENTAQSIEVKGSRLSINRNGVEVARVFLYVLRNDLHERPFALFEDVFVPEEFRGQGLGGRIVALALETARSFNCYKMVGITKVSETRQNRWYEKLGFSLRAIELRYDL